MSLKIEPINLAFEQAAPPLTQIILRNDPCQNLASDQDCRITAETAEDSMQPREPIADLLTRIGKILLRDEIHTKFLPIGKVARIAQKYKIKWQRNTHKTRTLEELTLDYFKRHDRLCAEGVRVKWKTHEPSGWKGGLMLSFHSYNPAGDGLSA
jgi:hypothetical protein